VTEVVQKVKKTRKEQREKEKTPNDDSVVRDQKNK